MRILHISTPKTWRGGEQQVAYLLQGLRILKQESHVFCPVGAPLADFCSQNSIRVTGYDSQGLLGIGAARQCAKLARSIQADCIHVHDAKAHNVAVLAASLFKLQVPIVVSRRVDFPLKSARFTQWKYRHPRVAVILCVSRAIREIVRQSLGTSKRIEVVYSGIDLSKFAAHAPQETTTNPKNSLRTELRVAEDVTLIGNVAALAPHKDHKTLLKVAERILADARYKVHFVLIGEGAERTDIEARIDASKLLKGNITLLGFRDDIPAILPGLDIFLMTSSTEGLGTSILDAFAARVAVVATQAGGIPELVIHEKTGLSAPVADVASLADSLVRLLQDVRLRQTLVDGAANHVQQFSCEQTAKQTLQIYRTCVRS